MPVGLSHETDSVEAQAKAACGEEEWLYISSCRAAVRSMRRAPALPSPVPRRKPSRHASPSLWRRLTSGGAMQGLTARRRLLEKSTVRGRNSSGFCPGDEMIARGWNSGLGCCSASLRACMRCGPLGPRAPVCRCHAARADADGDRMRAPECGSATIGRHWRMLASLLVDRGSTNTLTWHREGRSLLNQAWTQYSVQIKKNAIVPSEKSKRTALHDRKNQAESYSRAGGVVPKDEPLESRTGF